MNVTVANSGMSEDHERSLVDLATIVLEAERLDPESSVVIRFVDDEAISLLNEQHMGKSGPTDVLSFPIEDASPGEPPVRLSGGPPLDLGDIFISTHVVKQHADEYEVEFGDELHLMVCHGVLHLLGWDHITDEEAVAMEARETEHLAAVGRKRR
jgi:probable rRNA maturation factor